VSDALALGALALVASIVFTPLAMVVARRTGIVDRPGPLKPQSAPVPYLGGVAVFAALVAGPAFGRPTVVAPLAGAVVLGVLDDRFRLPASVRLVGQWAVGAGVAATVPTRLGGVGGAALVAAVTVLLMNGVNFLDGLDALASGVLAVAGAAFAVLLHGAGRDIAAAAAASLVGFLVYNRPPARVYLGDAGSYLLGALAAVLVAWAWAPGTRTSVGVAGLVLVAVPVAEVAFAVVRRLRAHQSLTSGDRRHPYDLVVARGAGRTVAAVLYIGVQALLSGAALGASASHAPGVAVAVALAAAVVLVAGAAWVGALSGGPRVPA